MNTHRILALADWRLDPERVTEELRRRSRDGETTFSLLVPARLRGLAWIGDPYASRPCAERLLHAVIERAARLGLRIDRAQVGDPEASSVVDGELAALPADEVLLVDGDRRHARRLARRLARRTRLPVHAVAA